MTTEMLYTLARLNALQLLSCDMCIIYDLINLTADMADLSRQEQETVNDSMTLDSMDGYGIV